MNAYIGLLCAILASSQSIDVCMPDGSKKLPPTTVLEPNPDVFATEDGFVPLKSPENTSEPSGAKPIKFGEAFHWLCDHQSKDSVYRLICKGTGRFEPITVIGWVPHSALLLRRTPLKTEDDKNQGVIRKALIVNSKEWIKDNFVDGKIVAPARYLGLLPNAKKAQSLKFFNILFVYKIDKKTGRALLGYSPKADYVNGSQLAGWFPENALCYWDTREAVQWNFENKNSKFDGMIRKTKAYAFNSKESAKNFREQVQPKNLNIPGKLPPLEDIIGEENIGANGESVEWSFDETRFPKISKPEDEETLRGHWGKLIQIGVIGSFRLNDGTLVNPKIIKQMRDKLAIIKSEIDQHYILFVIDNTGSMEDAFKKMIPDYIKTFTQEKGLNEKEKLQIKIAVAFYNDFSSDLEKNKAGASLDSTVQYYKDWVSIGDMEGKKLVDDLTKMEAKDGGDAREQVIHGVRTALEKSMASKKAPPQFAFKRCVVVGDMGNHVENNLGQNVNGELNNIANLLVPMNAAPWDFLPIQVPNPRADKGQRDPDYDAFTEQMKEIEQLRGKLAIDRKMVDIFSKPDRQRVVFQSFNNLSDYLVQTTKDFRKKSLDDAEKIIAGARGELAPTTELSNNLKSIFNDAGIDVNLLTADGYQFYEKAWVTTRDGTLGTGGNGVDQISIMTLVAGEEFIALKDIVKRFTPNNSESISVELLKLIVEAKLGETLDKGFKEDVAIKLNGLSFKSEILVYLFKALILEEKTDLSDEKFKKLYAKFLTKINRLKIIYDEIDSEKKFEDGIGETERTLANGIKYLYCFGKGDQKYFPRKFTLVGDSNSDAMNNSKDDGEQEKDLTKDLTSNRYYWLNDLKELP